jgi:hypothetical protein
LVRRGRRSRTRSIQRADDFLVHVRLGQRVGKLSILRLKGDHLRVLPEHSLPQRSTPQQRAHGKDGSDPRHRDRQKRRAMLRLAIGREQSPRR